MRRARIVAALALVLVLSAPAFGALTPGQQKAAEALVARLSAEKFADREDATRKLIAMGADVAGLIAKTLATTEDPETRERCRTILPKLRLVERKIVDLEPLPPGVENYSYTRTKDGEFTLSSVSVGGRRRLYLNGKELAAHAAIAAIALSADGRHYAFRARDGTTWFVVRDGVKGEEYEKIDGPALSPDGRRIAFGALRDGKWTVIVDGKPGPACDAIVGALRWSDPEHFFHVASRDGKSFLVMDGVEGPPHDRAWLGWDRETGRYVAADGGEVWSMQADAPKAGKPAPAALVERRVKDLGKLPPDLLALDYPRISTDAAHVAFWLDRGGGRSVFFNGEEIKGVIEAAGTSRQRRCAARARRTGGECYVVDGKDGPVYEQVRGGLFSDDGEHLVYQARRGGKWLVVDEGREGPPFDRIIYVQFSRSGAHFGCLGERDGAPYFTLDGKPQAVPPEAVSFLLSPDGSRVVWQVRSGRLVLDGRRTPAYQGVPFAWFSGDGRHLVFMASRGGKRFLVCDGIEGPEHDQVGATSELIVTEKSFRYFATDAGRESLVEVDFPVGLDASNGLEPMEP